MCHKPASKIQPSPRRAEGTSRSGESRRFVCAPYYPDASGRLRAARPLGRCVHAADDDEQSCRLVSHGFRDRKTGPPFSPQVMRCHRHDRFFTVYPPAFGPYARCPGAPLDQSGAPPQQKAPCDERPRRLEAWRETFFVAALDAAEGRLWLREPIEDDPPEGRYRTQARHLEQGARLLGLAALSQRLAEEVREHLGLDGLEHEQARSLYAGSRTLARRGELICRMLGALRLDGSLWSRLLAAGSVAGLWGAPLLFSPRLGRLVSPLSRVGRTLRGPRPP